MERKSFVISDSRQNRAGFFVLSSGGDVSAYLNNPVVLYMHERGRVIGLAVDVRLEGDEWKAGIDFDLEDPFAAAIAGKVDRGFIKAVSAGIAFSWADADPIYDDKGEIVGGTIKRWELREISVCDIPSNPVTLRLTDETGKTFDELKLSDMPQHFRNNPTNKMEKEILLALTVALGLPADADKAAILSKVTTLQNSAANADAFKTELEQLKAKKKADAEAVVKDAVKTGKLNSSLEEGYLTLAAKDPETTIKVISSMAPPADLGKLAEQGKQAAELNSALDFDEAVKKWDSLDKSGKLASYAKSNPGDYAKLFVARWGKQPSV